MRYTTQRASPEVEMAMRELVWYLPSYIFNYLFKVNEEVGHELLESGSKYQKAREARIGAILALCLFNWEGIPHYVALARSEPPDLYLSGIDFSNRETAPMIMAVEVTSFLTVDESLKSQLIKSDKTPSAYHHFDKNHVLLVNVGVGLEPDYGELSDYLHEINAPYEVWSLQDVDKNDTTYAKFVRVTPTGFVEDEVCIVPTLERLKSEEKKQRVKFRRSGPSQVGLIQQATMPDKAPWE